MSMTKVQEALLRNNSRAAPIRVTVSGSLKKHWNEIETTIERLHKRGAEVLSPINGPPIKDVEGFVYLREDDGSPDVLEKNHLDAIRQSDLLYIVNPGGYLGNSVSLEIGYALAWHTPIWTMHPFSDLPHRLLVQHGSVSRALNSVGQQLANPTLSETSNVDELQAYVRAIARARSFDDETPQEVMILLMEEVGELAKAMRMQIGLARSATDKSTKSISLELADCFIYILHLANQSGVKLLDAFRQKERINAKKKWIKLK